mgnify:FL=1
MLMVQGYGMGTNQKGHHTTSLIDAMTRGLLTRPDVLSETVMLTMSACQYM